MSVWVLVAAHGAITSPTPVESKCVAWIVVFTSLTIAVAPVVVAKLQSQPAITVVAAPVVCAASCDCDRCLERHLRESLTSADREYLKVLGWRDEGSP